MPYMMNNNANITLKPLGGMRGKRYDTLKGCTVEAVVYLQDFASGDYHHPVITLKKVRTLDDGERCTYDLVTLKFQRHNVNRSRSWVTDADKEQVSRGFLRGERGGWSRSYGASIQGDLDRMEYLQTGLSLIDRAHDAVRKDERLSRKLGRLEDGLLTLIVGLRKIGITVELVDAKPHNRKTGYSQVAA